MVNGFQMYLDEHNGMLGGAKVKFIVEDDQGKPDVDVTKAKKLILQDKVDMLVGAVLASSAYALAPVSTEYKMLYMGTVSTADDLAQRQVAKYPYLVLAGWVPSQPNHPLGQWACDQGYKRIAAVAADYAFGYEQLGGFQQSFEDCGGKIIQKIWVPLGTKDFGPYHPDHQERRRRDLHADGRPDVAAISQAAARLRQQEADRRPAAPATTNSPCPSWATR